MTTTASGPDIDVRQCADHAVTVTTNFPIAVVNQHESIIGRMSDGQHPVGYATVDDHFGTIITWPTFGLLKVLLGDVVDKRATQAASR